MPLPFEGGAIARVAQTGRTARIDLDAEPSDLRERMLAAKVSSGVAAPIVVSGRLWGATSLSNGGDLGSFPPGVETASRSSRASSRSRSRTPRPASS